MTMVTIQPNLRKGDFIQTYTGRLFWPLDPRSEEVVMADIAHALSMICRYCGHTREFYSVAQHSVLVSQNVPKHLALDGLLHDATEAYICYVSRPVKPYLTNYKQIEARLYSVIAAKFGIDETEPLDVKYADRVLMATELRDLMMPPPVEWSGLNGIDPLEKRITPLSPEKAKLAFMKRYVELI